MAESFDDRDGWLWLDGMIVPWRDATLHVLSHALHYGGAVFEGERAYGGVIFKSVEHSERLHRSAEYMDYSIPFSIEDLETAKAEVIRRNSFRDAYVRVIAWRGSQTMGVSGLPNNTHVAVTAYPWGTYYGEARKLGATLDIARWRRPSPDTLPCLAKTSGAYMICTLAKNEADRKGCEDALMFDYRGYVAESTGANIFFVKDQEVHTPTPDCFLNGITRRTVLGLLAKEGVPVHERHIKPHELETFHQCFLTGTAAEVTPVRAIGDYNFEIGPLVRGLSDEYDRLVRGNR